MLSFLRRLIQRYGFFKREPDAWTAFFRAKEESRAKWLRGQIAISKNQRLAAIARERCALKDKLAKAIRDKKARAPIYQALRALSVEEFGIESGRK